MDDYREKVSKIKSTLNFLKSDIKDMGKNGYKAEYKSKENYFEMPIQIGNKEKNAINYNDYTNNLNTEETDYTYNLNQNNYNYNNNNINNNNIHFKQEKVNENISNFPYLDTNSGNSEDFNKVDYTTKEISIDANNYLLNKNHKKNSNSKSSENKDETIGYLKNIKEEMKKFTDYNFDFEKINKNKTPEFKDVENKYKINTQNIQETNDLYYNNNPSFQYDYTYTLNNNNENNISNKALEYNEKKNDLFSNDFVGVINNNSKFSNQKNVENLQNKKSTSGLESHIQELRNQIEDLKRKNLFLEKKLSKDQGNSYNPITKFSDNNFENNGNILIEEMINILKVNQSNEIIPKLKMIMKNKKSEKLNQEFVEKLKDLYKTLITNQNQSQDRIDIKTIWRWIKSMISQMRNYAELVSENDSLKNFERNSRIKKEQVNEEKQLRSHSENKIIENKRINNSKNKLKTSTEKKTFKIGTQKEKIKNQTNIYESFCKDFMKENKINNLEDLKIYLTNRTMVSLKDKEKINAVKLLLEKSIKIFY